MATSRLHRGYLSAISRRNGSGLSSARRETRLSRAFRRACDEGSKLIAGGVGAGEGPRREEQV